jgi:hypothetical protein
VQRRVLGDEHSYTLFMTRHLVRTLLAGGKCAEAETMLCEVLEDLQRVLGPEHEETRKTMGLLSCQLSRVVRADTPPDF